MRCEDCIGKKLGYCKFDCLNPNSCEGFKDKAEWLRLPFPIGTQLYRVTHPYRQEPKITEFIVTNFVMRGKKHELMVEVRVNGVNGRNVMRIKSFFRTKAEAEKALAERKNYEE